MTVYSSPNNCKVNASANVRTKGKGVGSTEEISIFSGLLLAHLYRAQIVKFTHRMVNVW